MLVLVRPAGSLILGELNPQKSYFISNLLLVFIWRPTLFQTYYWCLLGGLLYFKPIIGVYLEAYFISNLLLVFIRKPTIFQNDHFLVLAV